MYATVEELKIVPIPATTTNCNELKKSDLKAVWSATYNGINLSDSVKACSLKYLHQGVGGWEQVADHNLKKNPETRCSSARKLWENVKKLLLQNKKCKDQGN